ncbi:hypothetical protein RHGRI_029840 [Rhododendron griersonianum]|uniref:WRKY domain-containing protein n=1 Tax=Rhododendron griersonianum TaxID=479676 RepID=A0AAV6IPA5_9ERIC|nr:hypothetical protein RHGRI_029840 [Rhododendron griersonianum]
MSGSTASQAMLINQGLIYDPDQANEDQMIMPSTATQMGFFSFPANMSLFLQPLPNTIPATTTSHQSFKTLTSAATVTPSFTPGDHQTLFLSSKQRYSEDHIISSESNKLGAGGPQLSLQRSSSANLWAWAEVNECMSNTRKRSSSAMLSDCYNNGGDEHLGVVSTMKMKKINMKARRKVREPRFCFKTMSDVDVLDDGYKWRKYGQKVVKNTQHPRSYYRCTQDNCRVKKRVERLAEDPRMVITTYEGRHAHSPSHDEDDSQAPNSHLDNFFF